MQNNNRDNKKPGVPDDAARSFSADGGNDEQPVRNHSPVQEMRTASELSEMDQQEGNMNNGTLGGNFEEDVAEITYEQQAPPY